MLARASITAPDAGIWQIRVAMAPNESSKPRRSRSSWTEAAAGSPELSGPRERQVPWRLVVAGIIAVALVLLIVQNNEDARFEWLSFDFTTRLWLMLLLSAVGGALAWEFVKLAMRRMRRSRADDARG
jgi:uncharacterized integral membrane protein